MRYALVLFVLLATLPGCAAAASAGTVAPTGTFHLVRVDGRPLPTEASAVQGVTFRSGMLELARNGRFSLAMSATVSPSPTPVEQSVRGRYRVEAGTLHLDADPDASASSMSFEARFAPGEVTLLEPDGTVFTFSASRR